MESQPRNISRYIATNGKSPFGEWLESLRDRKAIAKIEARLKRVELGNFGYCEPVGDGVSELKIDYGAGYRIYFGQVGMQVILLWGGDKSTQDQDIKKAKGFWADYEQRESASE